MELSVKSGHPEKQRTACLVLGVFESKRLSQAAEKIDILSKGYLTQLLRRGDIEGKLGQTLLLHNVPNTLSDRILLVGCGKERDLNDAHFKEIIITSIKQIRETNAQDAVVFLTDLNVKGREIDWKIRQATLATEDCLYHFDVYKSKKEQNKRPFKKCIFNVPSRRDLPIAETALAQGQAIAHGMTVTRDLANTPPNICTPTFIAQHAQTLAKRYPKITTTVLDLEEIKHHKMGMFLSVTQGSVQPPKFITIEYKGAAKEVKPIVLVGKGITFDTGGNSLKPAAGMLGMKYDMSGAATVLGVIEAVAELDLNVHLVGIIPSCENMASGSASRPDDIVTSMAGITVEITNTDAEGRLILGDALTYAERFHPELVIDIATLTGACVVALGHHATGLFSNHNPLAHELTQAGQVSGDRVWQLPLWDEYFEAIKSHCADMVNASNAPAGGSITAACFLSKFAKKYHWAHLDIAGTACVNGMDKKIASGRPVPLLMQFILNRVQN